MGKEQLKELFLKRLCIEYELFKDSMLHKEKEDIFEESYRIEIYKNLYHILIDGAAEMAEVVLRRLVYQSYGIMEFLYQEWLKKEDNSYTELKEYVSRELEDYYLEPEWKISGKRNAELERKISVELGTEPERERRMEGNAELETEIEETAVGKEGAYGKEHNKAA